MTSPLLRFARILTLASHILLAGLLVAWHGWLAPPEIFAPALVLGVLLGPLAVATPGLIRGRSYTHAWVSLLALLYFILAVDGMAAGVEPHWLPAAALTASGGLFVGSVAYVRAGAILRRRAAAEGGTPRS